MVRPNRWGFDELRHSFGGSGSSNPRCGGAVVPGHTVDISAYFCSTYLDDAQTLVSVPLEIYDIVLSDPPYSVRFRPSVISTKLPGAGRRPAASAEMVGRKSGHIGAICRPGRA